MTQGRAGLNAEPRDGMWSEDTSGSVLYLPEMIDLQTVGDLCTSLQITDDEVDAAVAAFLADPLPPIFVFRNGYRLNLIKAVRNHQGARVFMARNDVGVALKRPFVRAAILQARPKT